MMDSALSHVLGREHSLFADDWARAASTIGGAMAGARVLVVGAAGSIGRAFTRQLVAFDPAAVHLVDLSENNLVELVRELRAAPLRLPADFRTFAVGMGSTEFDRLLSAHGPYDHLVNFAAMKHVRSERDVFTMMRMVETNAGALYDLMAAAVEASRPAFRQVFSVSTDKASRPTSVMGATKRLMERALLAFSDRLPFTSARFANVAFSDGSLLQGWEMRLRKRQPLVAPSDIRRYFMSEEEAGQLCLLACGAGANREIFFPRLDRDGDLLSLVEVATRFLRTRGLEPEPCADEDDARRRAAALPADPRRWPCLFPPTDTGGEKPFEEFHAPGDALDLDRFRSIGVIRPPHDPDGAAAAQALAALRAHRGAPVWEPAAVVEALRLAVPDFHHVAAGRNLDQKM